MSTSINLKIGMMYEYFKLLNNLESFNYERFESEALKSGSYCVKGGSLEIFLVGKENPTTIDYFGNMIENIYTKVNNKKNVIESIKIIPNYINLDDGTLIKPNDFIVHIDHGIGKVRDITSKEINSEKKLYINLEYQNGDMLYLPITLKEKISKYIGVGKKPKLNKLGTQTWNNTKKRAYENALRLARELLQIYAKREVAKKQKYTIDEYWDNEIKKTFGYQETVDQLSAINEVYSDLQSERPMDRLISGDVGFGKTEVALRAMIQAVANQKQAVLICPTTLLASQHFSNIIARTKELPIEIAMLNRFVSAEEQKYTIEKIKNGTIDIIIGTHKIFSKEIVFKNLDMVVIDEEQRFGVRQKEYFKSMRSAIHTMSLSATPIPRTLFMSLSGIRDISQVATPPNGRKSIHTELATFNREKIEEYINREIKRNGQVYYLYNRVETMEGFRNIMQKNMPEVRFVTAHGQMAENKLSDTMDGFINNKYDVLICSTIIENGLDLPNVNTLIIDNADNFGLSQLYQIRGRIGRGKKQAFCLLTHHEKELSINAKKRLESLVENNELGSGINIALSDLEIRGGGNILGREQHGNMEAVGLVLYSQMLQTAVKNIQ